MVAVRCGIKRECLPVRTHTNDGVQYVPAHTACILQCCLLTNHCTSLNFHAMTTFTSPKSEEIAVQFRTRTNTPGRTETTEKLQKQASFWALQKPSTHVLRNSNTRNEAQQSASCKMVGKNPVNSKRTRTQSKIPLRDSGTALRKQKAQP